MSLTAIILTHNESMHLERAILSLSDVATDIVVVDSHSTDETTQIAVRCGARVFTRSWKNYADQFAWAMENTGIVSDWVMRLDADEVIHSDLAGQLKRFLENPPIDVVGIKFHRRHVWMGRWVRYGGRFPVTLVRVWRRGRAVIEDRWMDEHMLVSGGRLITLTGGFSDWNLNDLTFFTDKHNRYATREAVDVLIERYRLKVTSRGLSGGEAGDRARLIRLLKVHVYNRLPFWVGPLLYFIWRYFFRLGFLDGRTGLIYHVLQGFWYRFLVGAKLLELDKEIRSLASNEERVRRLQALTGHSID
jgi:glycosyltransferase involved in cell wall biosynthesis